MLGRQCESIAKDEPACAAEALISRETALCIARGHGLTSYGSTLASLAAYELVSGPEGELELRPSRSIPAQGEAIWTISGVFQMRGFDMLRLRAGDGQRLAASVAPSADPPFCGMRGAWADVQSTTR